MKKLTLTFALSVTAAFAQVPGPTLEQIKIAADAGDPAAQDKLAEQFIMRADSASGETWYRKAAAQGYAHAQGRLGEMLLTRAHMGLGLNPAAIAAVGGEGAKWTVLAANQGDKRGQADLAEIYLEGKFARQDLIEAFKWGDLAAQGPSFEPTAITGQSVRNACILKMSADQIAEAHKRVAAFVPHGLAKAQIPDPAWTQKIKLEAITVTPTHRFAIINGKTLEKGEETTVKIDDKTVTLHCVEIRESTVTVSMEGIEGTRELKMTAD